MSVREYLSTSYRPDCGYVDGVVLERNVGEWDHARLQGVPDVTVILGPEPDEQILTSAPFLCVEILSKDDRMSEMQERVNDCLAFGVPYVWILGPKTRKAWRCTTAGLTEVPELRSESPEIVVPLNELFA